MKAKDNKIDCARGMAAILMVIGHMGLQNGFTQYIYSFHMPLFFFLSGICIGKSNTEESIIKHIVKRTKRLLVPYILFSLIFSVPQYKNYILCFYASRESLYQAGSMTSLWFLPCLFAADCMFYMLRKICGGGWKRGTCILILSIIGCIVCKYKSFAIGIPFGIDIALTALVFIEIGYRIGETNVFTKIHRDKALLVSIILFLILIPTYRLNLPSSVTIGFNHVEMSIGSIGNALVFYCTSLMGSFAILFLAYAITSSRLEFFFAKFGNCTITCLVLHSIIISLVMLLTNRVGIPIWIAYTIILLLTPPLTFALHRVLMLFFPNLLGIGNK